MFHMAYALVPVLFLHFTLVFPSDRLNKSVITFFYTLAAIISLFLDVVFVLALSKNKPEYYSLYIDLFNLYRIFVVVSVLAALSIFIYAYKKTTGFSEKKKLKWILFGLVIDPCSFIFLWVIPQSITTYGLVPEELVISLMTSVPVAFGIAIVRYHLLNIDLILRRRIVYSFVIIMLLAIYVIIIIGISSLLNLTNSLFISTIAAVLIALISQPIKIKAQNIVDKKFYHINYNFRLALEELLGGIQNSNDLDTLNAQYFPGCKILFL